MLQIVIGCLIAVWQYLYPSKIRNCALKIQSESWFSGCAGGFMFFFQIYGEMGVRSRIVNLPARASEVFQPG